jgi:MFS family permease
MHNRLLAGFIGLSITSGTSAGIMQLILPLYALSLNFSEGSIGLLRGLAPIGGLFTTLPGGFFIDHFGARRVYLVSGLLDTLLILMIPLATGRDALMLLLFIEGGIATIRWTAINSSFLDRLHYFGLVRAGWMRAAMAIGLSFFGPLLAGQLVRYTSYPVTFAVMSAFIFVPLCFIPGFSVEAPQHSSTTNTVVEHKSVMAEFRRLATNRLLLRTGLLQSLAMACNHSFLVFLIILIVKDLGYSSEVASLVVSAQGIGSVVVMFRGGDLADRFRMQKVHLACFLMQIFGLVAAGFSGRLWLIGCGAVVLAMGTGLLMATSYSQLGKMMGKKGKISAVFFLITGAGVAFGPLIGGYLASLFGIRGAFIGFLPLEAVALGFLAVTWNTEKYRDLTEQTQEVAPSRIPEPA